jgi:hypothetical protein
MSWLSKAWKGVEKGWKDMWDPGRESRGKLEGLYNEQMGRQNAFQQDLINQTKQTTGQNREWAAEYLRQLKSAPDLAFNQGAAALERGIADTESSVTRRMAQRGILGSGVDLGALVNSGAARARGLSALQGQKVQGQLNTAGQAFNLMSGINSDALNSLTRAYGFDGGQGILNSYMNYLGQDANAPSPIGQLVSTAAQAYLGSLINPAGGMTAGAAAAPEAATYVPGANKGANAATRQMLKRLAMAQ